MLPKNATAADVLNQLPRNATATDVIDLLAEAVTQLVENANAGRKLTREQFAAAHERTFAAALPTFLDSLELKSPEAAAQLRTQFLAEEEERTHAG